MSPEELARILEAESHFAFVVSAFYKLLRGQKINPISAAIIASEFMRFLLDNAEILRKETKSYAVSPMARNSDIPVAS